MINPPEMLQASPEGTVPVLIDVQGKVRECNSRLPSEPFDIPENEPTLAMFLRLETGERRAKQFLETLSVALQSNTELERFRALRRSEGCDEL